MEFNLNVDLVLTLNIVVEAETYEEALEKAAIDAAYEGRYLSSVSEFTVTDFAIEGV